MAIEPSIINIMYTTDPVFPFGKATEVTLVFAATIAAEVNNTMNIYTLAMTGIATLNLTIGAKTRVGSVLVLKLSSDATARDFTPGTGMTGTEVAGVVSKTKVATYVFDGTKFVHQSTQQVN